MQPTPYAGQFIWYDLMSTDLDRAQPFLLELFGWETESQDMGDFVYTMPKVPGRQPFGGLVSLDPADGLPSHWVTYITTDDVDRFCEEATRLGGSVAVPPSDIPGVGRFAVVADPQGAYFSPMTELDPVILPPRSPAPGEVTWNELLTSDVEGATAFYTTLFGWAAEQHDDPAWPYTLLSHEGTMIGGIFGKPDDMPVSAWGIYFDVADIAQTLADAERLGGMVVMPAMAVPGGGTIAWVAEPSGAAFGLMQAPAG